MGVSVLVQFLEETNLTNICVFSKAECFCDRTLFCCGSESTGEVLIPDYFFMN